MDLSITQHMDDHVKFLQKTPIKTIFLYLKTQNGHLIDLDQFDLGRTNFFLFIIKFFFKSVILKITSF